MEQPHCNNSNNIHVGGAQICNYPTQRPDKNRCNGTNEDGCPSFDQGYSSFRSENTHQDHLGPKSELQSGHSQSPLHNGYVNPQPPLRYHGQRASMHSSYSGESLDGHLPSQNIDAMQSCLPNTHTNLKSPMTYSGTVGPLSSSYSGGAVDDYQRSEPNSTGPPLTPHPQNVYQSHMQNGYPDPLAPHSYSRPGGPMCFSNSGEGVDDCQRSEPYFSGFQMKSNPENNHKSGMQNGPTSPRPPPLIRKHSSFTRQNAIEEEEDDDDDCRDPLNDSGFGSMCRTGSQEKPRRSRSRDVSDAPGEEINNNLAPRKLQRAHSSTEKTDNEFAQYNIEKRRCSSEQLQRSSGSSGYFSANSIQGEVPAGDAARPCDLANAAAAIAAGAEAAAVATALAQDEEDITTILSGLHDNLTASKAELSKSGVQPLQRCGLCTGKYSMWEEEQLQEKIQSDPAFHQILAKEELSREMKKLSREIFLNNVQIFPSDQSTTSNTASHSTQQRDPSDKFPDSIETIGDLLISSSATLDTASHSTQQRDPNDKFLSSIETVGDLLISSLDEGERQRFDNDRATHKVPLRRITLDQKTRDNLQGLLERRAYCEAMEHKNCSDPECYMMGKWREMFEQCYRDGKLGECSDCREIAQAYWNHSQDCQVDRCVLPFCAYFKDLYSDGEILHDPTMHGFEEAFGCLNKKEEIDVLQKLHELEQLQDPAADDKITWSANAMSENYLRSGQPGSHMKPEGRLCKFGRFTPIQCEVQKQTKPAKLRVVIKKVQCSPSLTDVLPLLLRETREMGVSLPPDETRPVLQDIISTCLWYREIRGGKLLVCSSFLPEKSLSSYLEFQPSTLDEYWKEACNAAVFLHSRGILYLNWKVDHLVVTGEGVKLCNFDYAVDIRSERGLRAGGLRAEELWGTEVPHHVKTALDPRIAPPEVLMNGGVLFRESESWGLGCLLYQLGNHGCLPYRDRSHSSDQDIREWRLIDGHSKLVPSDFSMMTWLNDTCWNEDPMKRMLPGELPECLDRYRECLNRYR